MEAKQMSFVKQFVTVLFAAALLLSSAPRAYGQATTGELTGRVTDAASAVIPGVTVTLRSAGHRAGSHGGHQRYR